MRKGFTFSVSTVIGMAIFVLALAGVFLILQNTQYPGGMSAQVSSSAENVVSAFQDHTRWTVYRLPIIIHANRSAENMPVRTSFVPPEAMQDSLLVMHDGNEVPIQQNRTTNETLFIADLDAGATVFNLVYTVSESVSDRTYTSSLQQSGSTVWNEKMNVTFSSSGFSSLSINGTELLETRADIGESTTPQITTNLLRSNATYDATEKQFVTVYDDSAQIQVTEVFTGEEVWTLDLSSDIDTLYADGSTVNLTTSGILYTGRTNFVDLYNTSGLGIAGRDMFVNVSRQSKNDPVHVRINFSDTSGKKNLLLYAHNGNHTAALPYKQAVLDPPTVTVGTPVSAVGVSKTKASALAGKNYDSIKTSLGITGAEYNITIPGTLHIGRDIPEGLTVHATQFPVPVVSRFGNATITDLSVRVWNR